MPRDKFAALAAKADGQSDNRAKSAASATDATIAPKPGDAGTASGSGRDKFSAMASRSTASISQGSNRAAGRGGKFAAMAASSSKAKEESILEELKQKISKRTQVLKKLEKAEDLTCQLLNLAHQTTTALQNFETPKEDLRRLSKQYQRTLQELHPILSTGTSELIQPYRNHANETKQSMYSARVEMRLAKERMAIFKEFNDLEQEELNANHDSETTKGQPGATGASRKRNRE